MSMSPELRASLLVAKPEIVLALAEMIRQAVLEEREACARTVEAYQIGGYSCGEVLAKIIRERPTP